MLPGTIENNSNKEQDNNARSPVLENQIQQMLNKLMIDEDDTCINFSEEEQNLTDENEDEIKSVCSTTRYEYIRIIEINEKISICRLILIELRTSHDFLSEKKK